MSVQESKSKKELSDKELQKATGGADIDGSGGTATASVDATTTPVGWTDEEGVFHEGVMPGAVASPTGPVPNPDVGFTES